MVKYRKSEKKAKKTKKTTSNRRKTSKNVILKEKFPYCPICQYEFNDPNNSLSNDPSKDPKAFKTKCNHYFHEECLTNYCNGSNDSKKPLWSFGHVEKEKKCPLCGEDISYFCNRRLMFDSRMFSAW